MIQESRVSFSHDRNVKSSINSDSIVDFLYTLSYISHENAEDRAPQVLNKKIERKKTNDQVEVYT